MYALMLTTALLHLSLQAPRKAVKAPDWEEQAIDVISSRLPNDREFLFQLTYFGEQGRIVSAQSMAGGLKPAWQIKVAFEKGDSKPVTIASGTYRSKAPQLPEARAWAVAAKKLREQNVGLFPSITGLGRSKNGFFAWFDFLPRTPDAGVLVEVSAKFKVVSVGSG